MPKVLNDKGRKAAKAYAAAFILKYEAAILKLTLAALRNGVGSQLGTATGIKLSGKANEGFLDKRRGCKRAEMMLHPHKDVYSELGGSDADPDVPDAIVALKSMNVFPGEKFISGHVINAEFGGKGLDPENQTVLTSAANSQHHFDESVKSAWVFMTKAWEEMYRFARGDGKSRTYMEDLQKNWAIHVVGEVEETSWYDTYINDPALNTNPTVLAKYPLDCISTQVTFTATEVNGPLVDDIAENLQIDSGKMADLARHLSTFREHMSQAATFVVRQEPPATLAGRSPVSTEITDGSGNKKAFASKAHLKTLKVTVKKKATIKAPTKVVQPYFTTTKGTSINLSPRDNEVGAESAGYPWVGATTELEDEVIFYVTPDTSSGSAVIMLERGVTTKIVVNGERLTRGAKLSLNVGETIQVFDRRAAGGYHELTYGQQ